MQICHSKSDIIRIITESLHCSHAIWRQSGTTRVEVLITTNSTASQSITQVLPLTKQTAIVWLMICFDVCCYVSVSFYILMSLYVWTIEMRFVSFLLNKYAITKPVCVCVCMCAESWQSIDTPERPAFLEWFSPASQSAAERRPAPPSL